MSLPVTGNTLRLGFRLEEPSDDMNVGHPDFETVTLANPTTAPTVNVSGDPGTMVAGAYEYSFLWATQGRFRTLPGPASTTATVSVGVTALNIQLTDIIPPTLPAIETWIYRRFKAAGATDWGPWHFVTILTDTTAVAYNDTANPLADPPILDVTQAPPSANEVSGNYGFKFVQPKSADFDADYVYTDTKQLSGTTGPKRKLLTEVNYSPSYTGVASCGELVIALWGLIGRCTKQALVSSVWTDYTPGMVCDEPTRKYVFKSSFRAKDRRPGSFSVVRSFENSADAAVDRIITEYFFQLMLTGLDIATAEGKEVTIAPKMMGCAHTPHGPFLRTTGTGTGKPIIPFGVRQDAQSRTSDAKIKIQAALTAQLLTLRAKRSAGAAYGSVDTNVSAHATSNKHVQRLNSNVIGDVVELFDEQATPQALGIDRGSTLLPVCACLAGDLSLHDAADEFLSRRQAPIPGVYSVANPTGPSDDGSWTGFEPLYFKGPRFTHAHVTFKRGLASATDLMQVLSTGLKISGGLKAKRPHNRRACYPNDLTPEGDLQIQATLSRDYNSRELAQILESDTRLAAQVALVGEPIPIGPGLVSAWRESLYVDLPQVSVTTKTAVGNENTVQESATMNAEQPDADSDAEHFTATLYTREDIEIPS